MAELIDKTKGFLSEVHTEMSKVTWPDWPQLKNATLIILVFMILVAAVIMAFDFGIRQVLGLLIRMLGA